MAADKPPKPPASKPAAPADAARVIGLYRRHAEAFNRDRSRSLFEKPWLDRFLALAPAAGRILDLGCGHGEPIARHFIDQGRSVTGVDSSAPLVAMAAKRFPDQEWIVADMRGLNLGRRFDGLIAWDSFFHLTDNDQRAMFGVFAEHALPGAPLMFTSGPGHGEAIGRYQGERLYHASLDPAEYRARLDSAGFEVVDHRAEDPDCLGRTVWLAQA